MIRDEIDVFNINCNSIEIDGNIRIKGIEFEEYLQTFQNIEDIEEVVSSVVSYNNTQMLTNIGKTYTSLEYTDKLTSHYLEQIKTLSATVKDIKKEISRNTIPEDMRLNTLNIKEKLFYRHKSIDKYIKDLAKQQAELLTQTLIGNLTFGEKFIPLSSANLSVVEEQNSVEFVMIEQVELPSAVVKTRSDYIFTKNNSVLDGLSGKTPMKDFHDNSYPQIENDIYAINPYNDKPVFQDLTDEMRYTQEEKSSFYNKLSQVEMRYEQPMECVNVDVYGYTGGMGRRSLGDGWELIEQHSALSFIEGEVKIINITGQKQEYSKYKITYDSELIPTVSNPKQEFDQSVLNTEAIKRLCIYDKNMEVCLEAFVDYQKWTNDYFDDRISSNKEETNLLKDELDNLKRSVEILKGIISLFKSAIVAMYEIREASKVVSDVVAGVKNDFKDMSKSEKTKAINFTPYPTVLKEEVKSRKNDEKNQRKTEETPTETQLLTLFLGGTQTPTEKRLLKEIFKGIFNLGKPLEIIQGNFISFGVIHLENLNDRLIITDKFNNITLMDFTNIVKYKGYELLTSNPLTFSSYYTKTEADLNFSPSSHNHQSLYADIGHNHSSLYYTKTETSNLYSLLSHTHDDRYYQKTETYTKGEIGTVVNQFRQIPTTASADIDKVLVCTGENTYSFRNHLLNIEPTLLSSTKLLIWLDGGNIPYMSFFNDTQYSLYSISSRDGNGRVFGYTNSSYKPSLEMNSYNGRSGVKLSTGGLTTGVGYYMHNLDYTLYCVFKIAEWGANSNAVIFSMFSSTSYDNNNLFELCRYGTTGKIQLRFNSGDILYIDYDITGVNVLIVCRTNTVRNNNCISLYNLNTGTKLGETTSSNYFTGNYYQGNQFYINATPNTIERGVAQLILYELILFEEEHPTNSNNQNTMLNYLYSKWDIHFNTTSIQTNYASGNLNVLNSNGNDGLISLAQYNTFNAKQGAITDVLNFVGYTSFLKCNSVSQFEFNAETILCSRKITANIIYLQTVLTTNHEVQADTLITDVLTMKNSSIPAINLCLEDHMDLIAGITQEVLSQETVIENHATSLSIVEGQMTDIYLCVDKDVITKHLRFFALPTLNFNTCEIPLIVDYKVFTFTYTITYQPHGNDYNHTVPYYQIRTHDNAYFTGVKEDLELYIDGNIQTGEEGICYRNNSGVGVYVSVILHYSKTAPINVFS